jgi:non-ribosomal peptide synthetase component F
MWTNSRFAPQRITYNEAISIRKDGPLDLTALRRAFTEIVRRHEAWRTSFDRVGTQIVAPPPRFELPVLDLSDLPAEAAEHQAVRTVADVSRVPYDLRRGPLLRPRLIRFPGEHHRLYLAMHHMTFDGVSLYRVVLPELVALYDAFSAGRASPLPEPVTRYADYAAWEQNWVTGPRVARRLAHWRRRLLPVPKPSLPLDHPRAAEPALRGAVLPLELDAGVVEALRRAGHASGATLFQVVASCWAILLARYSGREEVVFATPVDLRQRPEFESIVGCCLSQLALRVELSGDPSFGELTVRLRNELLDGLDNLVPFDRIVRELDAGSSDGANPIYQTMIVLEPTVPPPDPCWSLHMMESALTDAVGNTKLDLELQLDERPDGHISGRLIYDRDLFEPATAARIVTHFAALARAAAADPTQRVAAISLPLDAGDRGRLAEWNATAAERPPVGLIARVREVPDAERIVVGHGENALSYGELAARAGAVARHLQTGGVRAGDVVALCAAASPQLLAGALGVIATGAAYLLIDPAAADPQGAAADAGAARLLTGAELAASDPGGLPAFSSDGVCCLHDGVAITHTAVENLVTAVADALSIGPADTILALPETLFAVPAIDLWLAIGAGARLVLAPAGADGAELSRLITRERVSVIHARPSDWRRLIETGLKPTRDVRALSGGEPLDIELAGEILDRCRLLFNAYGVAGTGGYATLARIRRGEPVTIGRPLANIQAHVLDDREQPVPITMNGALWISGAGAERPHRTGARARWRGDGELELIAPR